MIFATKYVSLEGYTFSIIVLKVLFVVQYENINRLASFDCYAGRLLQTKLK